MSDGKNSGFFREEELSLEDLNLLKNQGKAKKEGFEITGKRIEGPSVFDDSSLLLTLLELNDSMYNMVAQNNMMLRALCDKMEIQINEQSGEGDGKQDVLDEGSTETDDESPQ